MQSAGQQTRPAAADIDPLRSLIVRGYSHESLLCREIIHKFARKFAGQNVVVVGWPSAAVIGEPSEAADKTPVLPPGWQVAPATGRGCRNVVRAVQPDLLIITHPNLLTYAAVAPVATVCCIVAHDELADPVIIAALAKMLSRGNVDIESWTQHDCRVFVARGAPIAGEFDPDTCELRPISAGGMSDSTNNNSTDTSSATSSSDVVTSLIRGPVGDSAAGMLVEARKYWDSSASARLYPKYWQDYIARKFPDISAEWWAAMESK